MRGWQAALLMAACVVALRRSPEAALRRIGPLRATDRVGPARRRLPGHALATAAVVACAAFVLIGPSARVALVLAGTFLVAWVARRVFDLGISRRARRSRQRRVVVLCDALSAELRGGLPMTTVVRRCCGEDAELAPVVRAAALGGDIADALRGCARLPGADGLRAVAAAWDVAGSTGSALSSVLDRIAAGLRDDDEARVEVEAALGPPRATARMLALLPLFGLALGASIGAHPVGFLVGTSAGLACLCGGAGLALLGMWWVERLAAGAEV